MLRSVYIPGDDDNDEPPSRVLKVSTFEGGYSALGGDYMPPVVYFAIGEYDEATYEDSFKSNAEQQFAVTLEDLLDALGGLGAIEQVHYGRKVVLDATPNNR